MRKSAAALAVLTCILAGIAAGITGCAEQCVTETETTAETIEAIETLDPVETEETSISVFPDVPADAGIEIQPTISLTREMIRVFSEGKEPK